MTEQQARSTCAESLQKPDLPRKPPFPVIPAGIDCTGPYDEFSQIMRRYQAALRKYDLAKAEYDNVLYPAYRAAKKKAARPADDGARAVKRRQQNPQAAANHRRREEQRRTCKHQDYLMVLCERAIRTPEDAEGAGYQQMVRHRDMRMLNAVLAWEKSNPPDGTQAWWLAFCRIAKAAQSKRQSLWTTLEHGLCSVPTGFRPGLRLALDDVSAHDYPAHLPLPQPAPALDTHTVLPRDATPVMSHLMS